MSEAKHARIWGAIMSYNHPDISPLDAEAMADDILVALGSVEPDRTIRVYERMDIPTPEGWNWEANPDALMIDDEYMLVPVEPVGTIEVYRINGKVNVAATDGIYPDDGEYLIVPKEADDE